MVRDCCQNDVAMNVVVFVTDGVEYSNKSEGGDGQLIVGCD
jgi:hypothetical protein